MNDLTITKIDEAHQRIKSLVIQTPLISNKIINEKTGANVYFKLENLQLTGSFKIRGASNKILQLTNDEKVKGVVAFSSGNHAQAVAYLSSYLNINATIVMPKTSPKLKIENTKKYGANVILYDPINESREKIAEEIAFKENKKIIKPYDDIEIIEGQGTVGKEIAQELQERKVIPDIYLCSCGGGGLISGSSFYLKKIFPNISIFSVEPNEFDDTKLSLEKKTLVSNKKTAYSICDALLAPQPGDITFSINKKILKAGLSVSDNEVMKTIIQLAENIKVVAEPGGAVAATALLMNKINVKNKNVVVMISGGNIDYRLFSSIIKKHI